ncbi:MAG: arylsulfatase [Gemmataceae bacterium]
MTRITLPACLALVAAIHAAPAAAAEKPNVVIVLTDDQGYGDLSCHGNPFLKTPQLDKLHSQSVRLIDFHVCPMCTPTRGQLLSGLDCLRNGAMNVSSGRTMLRRGIPTMADVFASGGYRCGQFGKWHLGDNYPYRPQDRGFHETLFFPSSHIGSAPDFWDNDYFDDTYVRNGKREKYTGYCTDVFFTEAMKWMKQCAEKNQPFFCYLPTNAPHGPLFVPARYREGFKDQKTNVARYYGMIANIDENMGRLDSFLAEHKLADNTLVIFMTDNGGTVGVPLFNAGMRGRKIDLYEGGHRVPCFVRWPAGQLRQPGDVAGLTTVQDILPTLVDLCGLARPAKTPSDGVSLAKVLRGEAEPPADRTLVIQFSRMNAPVPAQGDACVLWKRWRLVGDKELYDLAADPAQKNDVIAKHPDVVKKLRARYESWWQGIAPKVNEHEAIIVGAEAENPLLLSPADWEDSFLDQGAQVRAGLKRNGAWNIEVARAGEYEITLRRWPEEAPAAIRAGRPAVKHADGQFPAGVALDVVSARLKVGDFEATKPVGADDQAIAFTLELPAGRTRLQTWFLDGDKQEIAGAYFVTVRKK